MRAPGVAWRRMPPFAWSSAVISWILMLIGPLMIAALTMLMIDRQFDGIFFDAQEGGAPLLYEHLAYVFITGCYLTVVIFAAGAISEILPTFARKPLFSHRGVLAAIAAIAPLGLLAWMQNMYSAPLDSAWTIGAMAFALALIVPIGVLFYNWIATLWGGTLRLGAPTWYAFAAISTMAFGLTGELAYSVIPVGWALDNTTATQGDTLYVLVGGGVMGGFAALHYWFPKLSGRLLGEGIGKAALGLMLVGIHLYVLPMFLAGLEGQPTDIFKYYSDQGVDGYNLLASIGAFILVIGVLLELGNAAHSWHHGVSARGHDPWGGATLEWFALSPPPPHNFDAVPDVRSPEPLHDIRAAVRSRTEHWRPPEPLERVGPPAPAGEPEAVEAVAPPAAEGEQGDPGGGDSPSVA
jgi:heme/copper-type cytochrome/quinol oxidase subunit 1